MENIPKPPSEAGTKVNPGSFTVEEGKLFQTEVFWRDHRNWLEDCGYMLRPRFQPDWVASWKNPPRSWLDKEDAVVGFYGHVLDATRRSDGAQVILKRIRSSEHPDEVNVGQMFSSEPLASDPRNHCIPIYEVLHVPDDSDMVIMVMPFLLDVQQFPFDTIGEVVEFFRQIFEGLQFMHQHCVSHRDAKYGNIMMDALPLYAEPPHPLEPEMKRNFKGKSKMRWSRTTKPVKYYFVDFGLSIKYPPDSLHLEPPGWGGDRTVPEFLRSDISLCDSFAVDIYFIGNVIRNYFLEGYRKHRPKQGFEFMTELVADMVKENPSERPKIDEVVERYAAIMAGLDDEKLRSRVIDKEEGLLEKKLNTFRHWCRQTANRWRKVPAIPTP